MHMLTPRSDHTLWWGGCLDNCIAKLRDSEMTSPEPDPQWRLRAFCISTVVRRCACTYAKFSCSSWQRKRGKSDPGDRDPGPLCPTDPEPCREDRVASSLQSLRHYIPVASSASKIDQHLCEYRSDRWHSP